MTTPSTGQHMMWTRYLFLRKGTKARLQINEAINRLGYNGAELQRQRLDQKLKNTCQITTTKSYREKGSKKYCDQATGDLAQLERQGRSHPATAKAVNMKIQTALRKPSTPPPAAPVHCRRGDHYLPFVQTVPNSGRPPPAGNQPASKARSR